MRFIKNFTQLSTSDIALVGGKNASLGEMVQQLHAQGVRVPRGFALMVDAYWQHLLHNNLLEKLKQLLCELHADSTLRTLHAQHIRELILQAPLPQEIEQQLITAYKQLCAYYKTKNLAVAVRSSATAEDLPHASFAGQHDSYLYISGEQELILAVKKCMASVFNERAIMYRKEQGFDDMSVGMSVCVQKMVRSDKASAGVLFTLDTQTGFDQVVQIEAAYGLGELVVQGSVTPQQFYVHKHAATIIQKKLGNQTHKLVPHARVGVRLQKLSQAQLKNFALTDAQLLELTQYALRIEAHYKKPMDIEWAQDVDGILYIVQARPETVHAREKSHTYAQYRLQAKPTAVLTTGQAIGTSIVTGRARVLPTLDTSVVIEKGDIIITHMTDPDWVPSLKNATALITENGGRTCHAAIVSRELRIPALVGTTNALTTIQDGQIITVDCSQGAQGFVYAGAPAYSKEDFALSEVPELAQKLMVNLADPAQAFRVAQLPVAGVGLARLEFIIATLLQVHPLAIVQYQTLPKNVQKKIARLAVGYPDVRTWYLHTLAHAIQMIAAAFFPRPIILRLTDFKTNEYAHLLGGSLFEHAEENPMLGFRGASRYMSTEYAAAFALECEAFKKAREAFKNIKLMVPFVRTVGEAQQVLELLAQHGLERGKDDLQIYMMVEIPSNIILFEQFEPLFDGFSIGSNDLTQLTLGVDRDSGVLAAQYNEQDPAVKQLITQVIAQAKTAGKPIGICGQAPSDYPEMAEWLLSQGISSISLIHDCVLPFLMRHHQAVALQKSDTHHRRMNL